eukprot:4424238-Alexandrium_andersonii.AAC.1
MRPTPPIREPRAARKQLWVDVARAAGIPDACHLTPETIRIVMAVLHAAGYRSAPSVLSVAKQEH